MSRATHTVDVLVVGAGPAGLTVAHELALAGVRATVVDRLPVANRHSKGLGLQPRTVEVLDMRALLDAVLVDAVARIPDGHFAGLPVPLTYDRWESAHPYHLIYPQNLLEQLLESELARRGVRVLRSHELVGLTQDDDGATAIVATPDGEVAFRTRYVIGCDGHDSAVRRLGGFGFPGTSTDFSGVVADVVLRAAPAEVLTRPRRTADLLGEERGDRRNVAYPLVPLPNGRYRVVWAEYGGAVEAARPVTEQEVRAAVVQRYGDEVDIAEVEWASRLSDAAHLVDHYRLGHVFVVGDAAHIHIPAGGQGLNVGVQDAMNLGWKLAAAVLGRAPAALLDTYHTERRSIGARVLENTRVQAYLTHPAAEFDALRRTFVTLLGMREVNDRFAGMLSGLDVRYEIPGEPEHRVLGARMPDLALDRGTLFGRLRGARGLLVADAAYGDCAAPWADRVEVARGDLSRWGATGVLVRPDGHVCWVAPDHDDSPGHAKRLDAALRTWFGAPGR
ncbi:FAD-dependent monooxygenase [Streptomyces sp. SID3343]|uniref:FAD-dependent monooxygenase n=1 Tax=Streptomyces sp. SID3343 TaxID=2690260 RepID=UPI00136DBA47|nr:FAD-dependent monooxygenase [Streptomyces sp. SID3343]MYV98438.1 FAD-binding protein [Streptomyces sp. SID3343]